MVRALHAGPRVPALFSRSASTAYRIALVALAVAAVALVSAPMIYIRTRYADAKYVPIEQPVEFDHRHHVRDDGIDCLYCHSGAETSASAGIPPTELCMGCHSQIWTTGPQLAPVHRSWITGTAIGWKRVYALPDHVYFHHAVHVRGRIPCASCHGAVDQMARVERVVPLTMGWCLDCHRAPPGRVATGRALTPLTTCSACHR